MTLSVLIVDDDETDRYIARRVFRRVAADAKLTELRAGDHLLELIDDGPRLDDACGRPPPPALVFLDINMPRMSGIEVLEGIRARRLADPTLIGRFIVAMFSSSDNPEDKARVSAFDFVRDYVVKPLDTVKLRRVLAAHYPAVELGDPA